MFKWHVILKDGSEILEDRGFGLSEGERKECRIFAWVDEKNKHIISVNLEDGKFIVNGQILHASRGDVEKLSDRKEMDYSLIYAKRHFFTWGKKPGQEEIGLYLIGWQFMENGRNYKRILYIYPNGEVIFGSED